MDYSLVEIEKGKNIVKMKKKKKNPLLQGVYFFLKIIISYRLIPLFL